MGAAAAASTWVAFVVGAVELVLGLMTLARRQVVFPWLRDRTSWKMRGWADVLLGTFILVETVPRLSGAPVGLALLCSVVAFIPLAGAVVLLVRSSHPSRA